MNGTHPESRVAGPAPDARDHQDGRSPRGRIRLAAVAGDRERAVLDELARETDSSIAFQGLRRRLDLHQETLSRALRRLTDEGFVMKAEDGYRLTSQGRDALDRSPRGTGTAGPSHMVTVLDALMPPHVGPDGVVAYLSRRWFRGLRWYGRSSDPRGTVLTWLAEPGNGSVRIRIAGGRVFLEVEPTGDGMTPSLPAARAVLGALAELYGLDLTDGTVSAFGAHSGHAA